MSQSNIPKGCYSIKSAAEQLGICQSSVFKKMRWHGWLNKGSFRTDPLKDMPLSSAIEKGFIKKIKRNSSAPYDWEIAITKQGLLELGGKMEQPTFLKPTSQPVETLNTDTKDRRFHVLGAPTDTKEEEREKFVALMQQWGIAS